MTTTKTGTNRRSAVSKPPSVELPTPDVIEAQAQQALADARAVTGMDSVYAEIEETITLAVTSLKDRLLQRRLGVRDVPIEGVGTITVRGLTKDEVKRLREGDGKDDGVYERLLVVAAMIEPRLTLDEVNTWQENASAGEHLEVMTAIQELSGLAKDAAKSGVPEVRD